MPARAAAARTVSQSTFADMPSPQTRPDLLIARNTRPCPMLAAAVQASTRLLTTQGWERFAHVGVTDQVRAHPVFVALQNRLELKRQQLGASQAAANQPPDHRLVA